MGIHGEVQLAAMSTCTQNLLHQQQAAMSALAAEGEDRFTQGESTLQMVISSLDERRTENDNNMADALAACRRLWHASRWALRRGLAHRTRAWTWRCSSSWPSRMRGRVYRALANPRVLHAGQSGMWGGPRPSPSRRFRHVAVEFRICRTASTSCPSSIQADRRAGPLSGGGAGFILHVARSTATYRYEHIACARRKNILTIVFAMFGRSLCSALCHFKVSGRISEGYCRCRRMPVATTVSAPASNRILSRLLCASAGCIPASSQTIALSWQRACAIFGKHGGPTCCAGQRLISFVDCVGRPLGVRLLADGWSWKEMA